MRILYFNTSHKHAAHNAKQFYFSSESNYYHNQLPILCSLFYCPCSFFPFLSLSLTNKQILLQWTNEFVVKLWAIRHSLSTFHSHISLWIYMSLHIGIHPFNKICLSCWKTYILHFNPFYLFIGWDEDNSRENKKRRRGIGIRSDRFNNVKSWNNSLFQCFFNIPPHLNQSMLLLINHKVFVCLLQIKGNVKGAEFIHPAFKNYQKRQKNEMRRVFVDVLFELQQSTKK